MIEYIYYGLLAIAGAQDLYSQKISKIVCWGLLFSGVILYVSHFTPTAFLWLNLTVVGVEVAYIIIASRIIKVGFGDVIIWVSLCFSLQGKAFIPIGIGIVSAIIYSKLFKKESVPLVPFTIIGLIPLVIL